MYYILVGVRIMRQNHLTVLKILYEHDNWMTSDTIVFKAGFSLRTLRNLIRDINAETPYILSSSKGYAINPLYRDELFNLIQRQIGSIDYEKQSQRIQYTIKKLLSSDNKLDVYAMTEELYISESTMNADLTVLRKRLSAYEIQLSRKKDTLYLIGDEKNIRKLLNDAIYHEVQDGLLDINTLQMIFPDYSIRDMRNLLLNTIYKYDMYTNDFSLIELILHLSIALNRLSNRLILDESNLNLPRPSPLLMMAREIMEALSQRYHVAFTESEILNLSLLLEINVKSYDANTITLSTLESYADKHLIDFVYQIIHRIYENFQIDLDNPDFIIRFSLHLNTLRNYHDDFKNPMYENIRTSYPLLFDVAVFISDMISQEYKITLSNHDISFIALHVGMALEDINDKKISTIVSVPDYHNLRDLIYNHLQAKFSDKLNISFVSIDHLNAKLIHNVSLIISTSPVIHHQNNVHTVIISPFLNDTDHKKIQQKIDLIENQKNRRLEFDFTTYFSKDHFMIGKSQLSPESIIDSLSQKLLNSGHVDEDFAKEVHYRESLSPTSYTNIALPHTLNMNAQQSALAVCVIPEGILWGSNTVNVVILLAISQADKKRFKDLFMNLINVFISESWNKNVFSIDSYPDFIEYLKSIL